MVRKGTRSGFDWVLGEVLHGEGSQTLGWTEQRSGVPIPGGICGM